MEDYEGFGCPHCHYEYNNEEEYDQNCIVCADCSHMGCAECMSDVCLDCYNARVIEEEEAGNSLWDDDDAEAE